MEVNKNCIKHKYVPNKLRAHPLYFYQLPIYVVFLTIMYWIVFCPIVYYILYINLDYNSGWAVPFFILSLTLYLLIIVILLCIWRCKRQKKYEDKETYRTNSIYLAKCTKIHTERQFLPLRPRNTCCCEQSDCTCSKMKYKKPSMIAIFPEKTPDINYSHFTPQSASPLQECEYFIANVSSPTNCTSEMFLFIQDEKPQAKALEVTICREVLED